MDVPSILKKTWILLAITLVMATPLFFRNAILQSPPMGYAGMFALMAEQLVEGNFRIPSYVPYYGPGGTPFAYPPLGLYILALLVQMTGKTLTILRFLPPLLSLLALIPLYFLALELSTSKLAAVLAIVLVSASPVLHVAHAWAAGIVRAPAFGFCLATLLYYHRCINNFVWRNLLMAGFFLGMTILTHLSYALFAVLWISVWTLFTSLRKYSVVALFVAITGLFVALPWVVLIISRHSPIVFTNALVSHGNGGFIFALTSWEQLTWWLKMNMHAVLDSHFLTFMVGLGIVYEIMRKRVALVAVFFSVALILSDDERFLLTTGFFLAGIGLAQGVHSLLHRATGQWLLWTRLGITLLTIGILVYSWNDGLNRIIKYYPRLDSATLDLGEYVQKNTRTDSIYLALTPQDEAEWLPYMLRRQPYVAQWGSEWLGTYDQQVSYMTRIRACEIQQDLDCLRAFFFEIDKEPDYLVTLNDDEKLVNILHADQGWEFVYQNARYTLWTNAGQPPLAWRNGE